MSKTALSEWRLGRGWWKEPLPLVELYLVGNIAFLAVDIFIAHAVNAFANPLEWVPVVFSIVATGALKVSLALSGPRPGPARRNEENSSARTRKRVARWLGMIVGWGAVVVGVTGLVLHLRSDFFEESTIKNLVYTAPFVAPLAYAGLGLVIILNRMVDSRSLEWARWVVLLAMGGFLGNFVLSLADHAQNGFFNPAEWTGVIAGAASVGILLAAAIFPEDRTVLHLGYVVMGASVVVGIVGFGLHVMGNFQRPGALVDRFLYGSPVFAPLLFADVAILGGLGLWSLERLAVASRVVGLASTGNDAATAAG